MARRTRKNFGSFKRGDLIARGGQAEVWSAVDADTGLVAALKLLPKEMANDGSERRFRRELRALTTLRHENIVNILEVADEEDRDLWYVMEYASGGTARLCVDNDTWSMRERLEALRDVCRGVAFLHAHGVTHRDLKPENMLAFSSNTGTIFKVADFGVIKRSGLDTTTITTTRDVVGTMLYWSPEHFRNPSTVDKRSDIYTLGVIYYEFLRGELPLVHGRSPEEIARDLDRPYSHLIPLLLSSNPEARLQSVEPLITALESLIGRPSPDLLPSAMDLDISAVEQDVLRLVTMGLSNHQIGSALGLPEVMVGSHVVSLVRKAGVGNRPELIRCFT